MFSHNFPVLSKFTIPMFWVLGTVWLSASPKIWKKHLNLGCFFPILFPYFLHFPHFLGTILLMWKQMKTFYFWSHFHTNVYVKLFTKELNLFCSWAPTQYQHLRSLCYRSIWKCIQCRRAGSVFYSSASIGIGIQSECQSEFF